MITLAVPLGNEVATSFAKVLACVEAGLTELVCGGTRLSHEEEDDITRSLTAIGEIRTQFKAHDVECARRDREDIRERGRKLRLLERMRARR